jgi:hypothetical protein
MYKMYITNISEELAIEVLSLIYSKEPDAKISMREGDSDSIILIETDEGVAGD